MKILLLEDDLELCTSIQQELEKNGYMVDSCYDGETALLYALTIDYAYDLAIIDRMLPIVDGLTIIKAMRQKQINIPILIITGMSAVEERIDGLDGGADDYLVKPFYMRELLARVRALIRRPPELVEDQRIIYADLMLDKATRILTNQTKSLTLTAKETELLAVLMQKAPTLFSKEQLILKIWGTSSSVELGNVDNYISFLRKRLKELKSTCEIKTIYGAGYKLENNDA